MPTTFPFQLTCQNCDQAVGWGSMDIFVLCEECRYEQQQEEEN